MLNSKAFPVFTDIPGVWWHIHEEHCCERGQGWRTELPGCLPVVYVCQWPGVLGRCKRGLSRYPGHLWKFLTSTPLEKFAFQQAENSALVTCEMWPRSNAAMWFQLDTYWLVLHTAGVEGLIFAHLIHPVWWRNRSECLVPQMSRKEHVNLCASGQACITPLGSWKGSRVVDIFLVAMVNLVAIPHYIVKGKRKTLCAFWGKTGECCPCDCQVRWPEMHFPQRISVNKHPKTIDRTASFCARVNGAFGWTLCTSYSAWCV